MSSLTGYLTSSGIDLSFIFQSGNSGLTTGYIINDGRDIGFIFKAITVYTTPLTGLTIQSGADISTLFDGVPNTPLPSIPGCCMWLDSTDTSTITLAGSRVTSWVDKSVNKFVFNQTTNDNRPTYTANSRNTLATITFDRTFSQYLLGPSNFSIGTSSYSLFVVCNITVSNTTICGIFNKALFGSLKGRIIMVQDSSGLLLKYTHDSDAGLASSSATYTVGNYRILELIVNQTSNIDYAYQNGTFLKSVSITDSYNYENNACVMLIGAYNNGQGTGVQAGYFLSGNIAEIVAFKGVDLTDTNRQRVEGYLAWKWGIATLLPTDHPYRYMSPSVAAITGCCLWLDASDSATITTSSGSRVSQWRDKSSNAFAFNQITTACRPVNTNTQNGLKTITFTADSVTTTNSDYLLGPDSFSIGTSSYSLFVVCNVSLNGGVPCGIFNKSRLAPQDGRIIMVQDSGNFSIQYTHPNDTFLPSTPNVYTVGNYRILELIVNRTEGMDYAYQNGSLLTSIAVSDTFNYENNTNRMMIGAYPDSTGTLPAEGYYLSGNVAEILSYKGADMTTTNRQNIEGYLAWKWGIQTFLPSEHPNRNTPPN
jgi:antitoxin component YwqK of YwqJK toxin-antitoxin module